jgi:hypothetical protein
MPLIILPFFYYPVISLLALPEKFRGETHSWHISSERGRERLFPAEWSPGRSLKKKGGE